MLPGDDWEASSWAEERACHSIVRLEVLSDAVVVGMQDKDWVMALHGFSLMLCSWTSQTLCLRIGFCL